MRFGMNLFLWDDTVTGERHLPLFERLKAMGFDGLEVPIFGSTPGEVAELGRRLDDLGLDYTAVTAAGEANHIISADPAIRQAGIDHVRNVIDCCQAAGIDLLSGPFYAGLGVFSGAGPTDEEWGRAVESFQELSAYAAEADVTLALEYLNRFETYLINCAADAARLVRDIDHPNCRMMLDSFHMHIEEKDVTEAITGCADVLVHVQVSENDRGTPGAGQVRWGEIFGALKHVGYDGWLTIEAFGTGLAELARATCIWRRMYDTEERLAEEGLAFIKRAWESATPADGVGAGRP